MQQAKSKAKQGSSSKFSKEIDRAKYLEGIQPTKFLGYNTIELQNSKILKDLIINDQHIIIFDKTPFYAESG